MEIGDARTAITIGVIFMIVSVSIIRFCRWLVIQSTRQIRATPRLGNETESETVTVMQAGNTGIAQNLFYPQQDLPVDDDGFVLAPEIPKNNAKLNKRTPGRRLIPTVTEPEAVTVTRVTETGIDQSRIPLRPGQDILDEDGFVIVPETSRIEASPMVVPPYPVEPLHPTPQAPGFAVNHPPYPTQNPHPVGGPFMYAPIVGVTSYPPAAPAPYPPTSTPYPPTGPPVGTSAPYPDYTAQPPSYSEAVAQPPVQPPLPPKEGYVKQSPYNPNY